MTKTCIRCGFVNTADLEVLTCPKCNANYMKMEVAIQGERGGVDTIECKQCRGTMRKTKKTDSSLGLQIVGVILFLVGLCMLIFFPIGTLIGIIIMIVAARLGYTVRKVWKCETCGYFFERD